MTRECSTAGLPVAAILVMLWPTAALAQDLTGIVVVAAPAALAAPLAAAVIKSKTAAIRSRHRLVAVALAELGLWALVLPAGSLLEWRMLGLGWQHSAMAMLLVCATSAVALNFWVQAAGRAAPRLSLALLFAALTPLAFLLIGGAVWALLAAFA